MRFTHWHARVCVILGTLLLSDISFAQGVKASFIGSIRDRSGAVVPDATITATNLETNVKYSAVTDNSGSYLIPFLDPGTYSVTAEHAGFKTAVEPKVKLDVGATVRVDLALEIGQTTQRVEVSAAAPLVQSDTSDVGMVVTTEKLTQLPLLGRNYQALAQLSPGAVSPTGNPVAGYMAGLTTGDYWQVAGQRGAYTAYTADGIETNNWVGFQGAGILQSLDTIDEYKIESHNFSAESGRGTVQFTASTRAGTNTLHGSAFEFLRNDKLNANDFFANKAGRSKRAFRYNQFGATIGGPIFIPKLYNGKDKTFFFFGYQGTRYVSSGTAFARFPDPAWLTGDFSNLRNADGSQRVIYDPETVRSDGANGFVRMPFPGNRISSQRFDPVAAAAIPYVPKPTSVADIIPGVNTVGTTATRSSPDQYVTRVDHNFSSNDRVYGRYMQSKERYTNSSLAPLSGAININNGYNAMGSETHVFSSGIVNEFRFGWNRANFGAYQEGGPVGCITACTPQNFATDVFKLKNLGAGLVTYGLTNFAWSGYSGIGGPVDSPLVLTTDTYQVSDNLIIARGRHSMKLGFLYGHVGTFYASETFSRGYFGFNGQFTQGTQSGQTASGNPLADFLLGYSNDVRGLAGDASGPFRTAYQGYYFQDDFRVGSRLTLNLGLRWEYYSPYTPEKLTTRFDFGSIPGSCFGAGCPPGRITVLKEGQPLYKKNWHDWSPRIGFAYSPFGNNKTVIRASYGIFYSPSDGTDNGTWGVFNPPQSLNFFFSPDNPYTDLKTTKMSNQFPGGTVPPIDQLRTDIWPLPALSLLTEIPIMEDPTIHQWQFTVQREMGRSNVLELGYLGSHGYHGQRRINYNQARLDRPGELTPIASRLPYPVLSSLLFVAEHSATNSYNAGFVRFERRFSNGFSLISSYTFAKTLDDYGNLNGPGAFWPQYSYNKRLEKGISAFNARHRFTAGYVYEIPFGRGRRFGSALPRAADIVLGGWQVNGITTFQSGNPLHPALIKDQSNTGNQLTSTLRPNLAAPIRYMDPRTTGKWFNPDAFALPALGTLGNAARGVLTGPGINNWDLGIAKNFRIRERGNIQFRGEMFNAFNHTQFSGVNVNIDPSLTDLIGVVTSARAARNIQFGLRIEF